MKETKPNTCPTGFFHKVKMTKPQKALLNAARNKFNKDEPRYYRCTYDWTVYSNDGLAKMETYWDAFAKSMQALLPSRMLPARTDILGCNFGTNNGALQKAWQRLGYAMYGVEYHDYLEELKRYGCEGIRASFYDLSALNDALFDFGILDRCMFQEPLGWENQKIDPPLFEEIIRTLKSDGCLMGIFYGFWNKEGLKELNGYGALSYKLTWSPRNHPHLAFSLDLSKPSQALPSLEDDVSRAHIIPETDKVMLTEHLYQITSGPNDYELLYVPTNEIITVKAKSDNSLEIVKQVDYFTTGYWPRPEKT